MDCRTLPLLLVGQNVRHEAHEATFVRSTHLTPETPRRLPGAQSEIDVILRLLFMMLHENGNDYLHSTYLMLISINPSLSINFTPQQSKSIIDVNVYKYIVKQCKHEIMKFNKIRPNLNVE